jgi:uracil-DNA glycosylase family 4
MLMPIGLSRETINFTHDANTPLIIAFGETAAHQLLQTTTPLELLRGQSHTINEGRTTVIVTYHPNELLLQPLNKQQAYQDLLFIKKILSV